MAARILNSAAAAMPPLNHAAASHLAPHDALGFERVCELARFRWVRVSYVHACALDGGPAPRWQDLPDGTYVDGAVPAGATPFVVSYPWAAHLHPFPGGGKLRELAALLRMLLCVRVYHKSG